MLFCFGVTLVALNAAGQTNPNVAVLPGNNGIVAVGQTINVTATIGNTGTSDIATQKLRPIFTLPASVTFAPSADQTLPTGWTILTNTGSQIRLCNTTTTVAASSQTNITLRVIGVTVTGAQTFSGQINFGNGTTCASGTSTAGNATADDNATSTIEVIAAPLGCNTTGYLSLSGGTIACNGGTGTLTATASQVGGPTLEYSIDGGTNYQASNSFSVTAAGSPYTIIAREVGTSVCSVTSIPFTASQPTLLTSSASVSSAISVSGGTGSITVTSAGGTGAITYTITSGPTSNTTGSSSGIFTGLDAGTYTFTATDANSCTAVTASVELAACTISAVSASAGTIACNGGTTTLTATATGTGSIQYSLNGGTFQSSNTFTVNAAGSPYTVRARIVGNTACLVTATAVTVTQPALLSASGAVTSPIAVIGETGTITVTATGGTGTLAYAITSGPTTNTTGASSGVFSGLDDGSYTFTVTDANSCTRVTATVVLAESLCGISSVSLAGNPVLCFGGTTTLTATLTGSGNVEYSLNGGTFQSSNTFTVSASGTPYTVVARDPARTSCSATSNAVTISQPAAALSASGSVTTPIAIPGGKGTITVSATGGTGTKAFVVTSGATINTTGASSGVFSNLDPGAYVFTATDANSCTDTAMVTLASADTAQADPAVGAMYFTTTAGANQDANNLLLAPSTAVYDINVPFYNLNQTNAIPNQTIEFRVNLGRKLILNPSFNLATAPLSAYFSWTETSVGGDIILVGAQTAAIPADFNGIATFRVKGDSACRSNVVSNIVITSQLQPLVDDDAQNNTASLQYNLPITLTRTFVNITCNGASNGSISVVASSGTRVIVSSPNGYRDTTHLPSGSNNFTKTGLAPGVYTIAASATSVSPLADCSVSTTATIAQPSLVVLSTPSVVNIACFGASDASISVAASGGTSPYTYVIAGPTVNTSGALSGSFSGLTAGSYTITVTDNNGCTAQSSAIVITAPSGTTDISLGSDVTATAFNAPGITQTIVYNIAEIAASASVGDTIRITKVNGFTINFSATQTQAVVGSTTYNVDNTNWKIDNSNAAFVSIILTDPGNSNGPGTILCSSIVRVAISITRNTPDISVFTLSARLRKADGEVNLNNNLNSIIFSAE